MRKIFALIVFIFLGVCFVILPSCSGGKRLEQAHQIVINEVMPSNRTGLLAGKKKPVDWVELKNNSNDSIDLEGFSLKVIKTKLDTATNKQVEVESTWDFPEVTIKGGEYLVVFAKKKKEKNKTADDEEESEEDEVKEKKPKKEKDPSIIIADLALPKEGGTLQFCAPNGDVISEVKYGALQADQSLARKDSVNFETTYWQSPGFPNTKEGYEKAMIKMDDQRKDPLKIWEVMSRAADSSDNWVELKNTGETDLNLEGYRLSKKLGKNEKYLDLPSRTLKPGEIIVIQLSGRPNQASSLHAPFKLGKSETIILSKDKRFIDGVCAKPSKIGGSVGRLQGEKGFFFFGSPTKDKENGEGGKRHIAARPGFNYQPGVYADSDSLILRLKDKDSKVRYTTDGSIPGNNSPLMKDSLIIRKNMTLRTVTEGDSVSLTSPVTTNTYLFGKKHDIAVMNVTINEGDMYNPTTGIYVNGPGYDEEWPHKGANYWKPMVKRAHVEFFDGKGGFATDCGFKIFGGFSRAEDKKSFTVKFKGQYGNSRMDYDFFGNGKPMELKDLVLRSGSQDWNRCMVRDEFFTSLMAPQCPELLIQNYRPVALYINAQYFGLYYFREKIDKHFVSRKLEIPNDSINIMMSIGYNEEGSKEPYQKLMSYVANNDLKNKEHYNYIKDNVDLLGLIDYKLGEIYSGNSDVGNIRYVRSTHPESDKKWHFVFYDLDASWVDNKSTSEFYISTAGRDPNSDVARHNRLISKLLENPEFRALFLQRLSHHLTNTFSEKNATMVFDNLVKQITPEMKYNCERWPKLKYETWEKNIADFRARFKERPKAMLASIRSVLNVTDAENKKYFSQLGY